jgi:hypothetical protein
MGFICLSANRTRYTDDTQSIHSFVFPTGRCRALRCDRCLAINYVIQQDVALSRRKRGFKSRRGRQINRLGEKRLLSI